MESIRFYSTDQLKDKHLLQSFNSLGSFNRVETVNNFYEWNGLPVKDTLYKELVELKGQFRYDYSVFILPDSAVISSTEKVDMFKDLAIRSKTDLLAGGEEINPYVFIHITSEGQAFSVSVDVAILNSKEELEIKKFYPLTSGAFATPEPLSAKELLDLKKSWPERFPVSGFDELGSEFHFESYRKDFPSLTKYRCYYLAVPSEKNAWLAEEDRAQLLIDTMFNFSSKFNIDLCLFPANSTTIKNIPGGSDSESYCINVEKGKMTKIIFKARRDSWG